ncbi:MAG TPA: choice-of-anchor V domain-containing protein [Bryobacteraceae bacterium]
MTRGKKIFCGKTAAIFGAVPVLVWAYAAGPDGGKAGVPGESTCAESGCHTGTALNGGKGSVSVTFPGGLTYTPGVKQHLTVTISDPTQRRWGFQLTARSASDAKTQAGEFASTDRLTAVVCMPLSLDTRLETFIDFGGSQSCLSSKPLAYIEHTLTGSSRNLTGSGTYEFDWTPPASDMGDIKIYVAGNAANGDGNNTGDHIYTASYTLKAVAAGPAPTIAQGAVVNGASFAAGIVPGSWVTIKGANLSAVTDTWDKAIVDGQLPTQLDNVSVTIGGKPAYVNFVSAEQINVLAPDIGLGNMQVTVTNGGAASAPVNANVTQYQPAFFLWTGKYAVATRQDFSLAVANGTFPGTTTTPAKPGDVIILWGTGFGPTSPAAPSGVQVPADKTYSTANSVSVKLNGVDAQVFGAALAPGFAGLYQVAFQVPASAPDGDLPIVATINGANSPDGVLLTVKR